MKIAFFVNFFPAVSETFILNQMTGLIDRGHTLDIYSFMNNKTDKIHPVIGRYQLMKHLHFFDEIPRTPLRFALRASSLLVKNFPWLPARALSASIKAFDKKVRWIPQRTVREFFMMPKENRYDILHCQFGELGAAILKLRKIGALHGRLVTSFRGHDGTALLDQQPGKYDELYAEGDFFLPVSHSLEHRLIQDGCDSKKIRVLRSGIDLSKFTYAERKLNAGELPRVLTIARLVERKGIDYALKAVAELKKSGRKVLYSIVGDGEERGNLELLIRNLNLKDEVQLHGWYDHSEVRKLLAESHLLLCPSVTVDGEQEGVPNVVKEAMAMGLPVIGTDNGGTSELIENGASGFIVPERDVDAIVDRMAYLIDHPEQWPIFGRKGVNHVQKYYEINSLNDDLVHIYQSLLMPSSA